MARALRIEYPGALYHVTSRGNERKDIFRNRRDREQFLSYLESATIRYGARVQVYCLMSNHYHLLMETPRGNLSQIMAHINGAYTTYFNAKRQRSGHLFQGRYKGIVVEQEAYAEGLSRYIHLNPVRAKIVARPEEYAWSSYRAYVGVTKAPAWLDRGWILSRFGSEEEAEEGRYRDFVEGMIGQEPASPLGEVAAATVLGSATFIAWVQEKFLGDKPYDRELPALRELSEKSTLEAIRRAVEERFPGDRATVRRVGLYLSHRYSGRKLREIAAEYGVGESAVTQASARMAEALKRSEPLRRSIQYLKRELGLCEV